MAKLLFTAITGTLRSWVVPACLMAIACTRDGRPADDRTARTRQQLVGTWRAGDGQAREYVLAGDGSFSLKMNAGGCGDANAGASTTASGEWSVDGGSLVLRVKASPEPVMQGVVMKDEILELGVKTLVLNSSVSSCQGQRLRLSRL